MEISISLDSKARILAGLEPASHAVVEIPVSQIPEDLRPILTTMPTTDGQGNEGRILTLSPCSDGDSGTVLSVPAPIEGTPETVIQWLLDYQDARAVWQAAQDAKRFEEAEVVRRQLAIVRVRIAEAQAAGTLHALTGNYPDQDPTGYYVSRTSLLTEGEQQEYERLDTLRKEGAIREVSEMFLRDATARVDYAGRYLSRALSAEASAEAKRRAAADQEEATRLELEQAGRKHAQLADAVARLGDESQRARWAEDLLPAREAVDLIVEEALAPVRAAGIDILWMVTPGIEHTDECHEGDDTPEIDSGETVLTKLSAKTYAAVVAVRAAVPRDATAEAVKATAKCEQCEACASQTYIRASWMVGEIEVTINVAV